MQYKVKFVFNMFKVYLNFMVPVMAQVPLQVTAIVLYVELIYI